MPHNLTDHEFALLRKDAERWRYTQRKGYSQFGPYTNYGDFVGYSVGIRPDVKGRNIPANSYITGCGDTLQKAIDAALTSEQERGEKP